VNKGIFGYRSDLEVYNSNFDSILYDAAYTNPFDSTAIVSLGDSTLPTAGKLTVHPTTDADTAFKNSYRGVYTDYSELTVSGVKMFKLKRGVQSSGCTHTLSSRVTNCEMAVSEYGILWRINQGSSSMAATYNTFRMYGRPAAAIYLGEANNSASVNYSVTYNIIYADSSSEGITSNSVYRPIIDCNEIYTLKTGNGISLYGNDAASVSFNTIKGNNASSNGTAKGMVIDQSENGSYVCNTVDSTYRGFHFGGQCPGTLFKGNAMNDHYVGLYLNNVAVIDKQPPVPTQDFHGNIWLDTTHYSSGYGAVNLNDTPQVNLQNSLFATDKNNAVYNPKFPLNDTLPPFYVNDQTWFDPQNSGNTFSCGTLTGCDEQLAGGEGSQELMMMIANEATVNRQPKLDYLGS
jgi:hypothetical protein